jgi:hypothetical protein
MSKPIYLELEKYVKTWNYVCAVGNTPIYAFKTSNYDFYRFGMIVSRNVELDNILSARIKMLWPNKPLDSEFIDEFRREPLTPLEIHALFVMDMHVPIVGFIAYALLDLKSLPVEYIKLVITMMTFTPLVGELVLQIAGGKNIPYSPATFHTFMDFYNEHKYHAQHNCNIDKIMTYVVENIFYPVDNVLFALLVSGEHKNAVNAVYYFVMCSDLPDNVPTEIKSFRETIRDGQFVIGQHKVSELTEIFISRYMGK